MVKWNITKGAFWCMFCIRLAPILYHLKTINQLRISALPSVCDCGALSIYVLRAAYINLLVSLSTQQFYT